MTRSKFIYYYPRENYTPFYLQKNHQNHQKVDTNCIFYFSLVLIFYFFVYSDRVSLQASELRSLSLLSYFGSSQQSTSNVITVQEHILHHCTVYSLPISTLRIYNCSENVSCPVALSSTII